MEAYDMERCMRKEKYTLQDVHHCNDLLLAEVDRLCSLHDIKYYMDSGTLIGAVRHKGNIPWDDDVDICMSRRDFERFEKHCLAGELSEGFEYVHPRDYGENHFFDFIPHIAYTKSHIQADAGEMEFYNGKLNHILLDIFILDDMPPSAVACRWKKLRLKLIYMLSWAHRYEMDYSRYSPAGRLAVAVMSRIGRAFSQTTLLKWYDRVSRSDNGRGYSDSMPTNYPPSFFYVIFKKQWFSDTVKLPMDEFEFCAPAGWDALLRECYGDYMQLPPEEKRHPEHYDVDDPEFWIDM